ncbi:MAG: stage II sporulation protein R [Clostridia bacterium]|nr:stage II sporulation protein R [Clostridia bacterium]
MKLKAIDIAVFITLIICIGAAVSFESTCKDVREDILRLHVIANSDSAKDQALKLKVRDSILKKSENLFTDCEDIISAEKILGTSLLFLKQTAQNAVYNEGYSYSVKVAFGKSYFPTRVYENITLPAGYYDALKIIIGEGKGQNWWCVMFPSLCLPGACKKEDILSDVLSDKEMKLVLSKPEYEVRFWLVEKYYDIKNYFSSQK